ncbi:hypothetical protein M8C21_016415 [Ambrosia artemisiifolia]|uniref:Uncharacterized protein n=1 Tax=Ambrosia artemisiifolia TaxID=4212 RepID=A0AAD5C0M6_AMBAR|nr:hypothetical protein M8C21_016415 [Ambrosia artemisiifolia]
MVWALSAFSAGASPLGHWIHYVYILRKLRWIDLFQVLKLLVMRMLQERFWQRARGHCYLVVQFCCHQP